MIMTQEDKEILIRDLCARLPYGIKASYYGAEEERETWDEIESITLDGCVDIGQYSLPIERIKPYLFPLSSITKEQLFEVQEILGKDVEICNGFIDIVDSSRKTFSFLELQAVFEWLLKNHFDYRGLIERGLAIDATGLNIY